MLHSVDHVTGDEGLYTSLPASNTFIIHDLENFTQTVTMPSDTAESISKHSFGDISGRFYNMSNITHLTEGPEIDRIREQQFYILLPSFVYTFVLMFLGLPGNLTVIIVYTLKMAKTTSRHFIISLAVCDFINCAFGMPVELSLLTNFYNFDLPILCKISRFMTFFMNNTSSCVLIGIAVDRFRRVCLPLRPNMTVKQSRTICITVAFISMLSAAPSLYIYGTRTIHLPGPRNDTLLVMKTCYIDDGVETRIPLIFNLYMFIFVILMFLCLIVMYSLVGRVICTRTGFSEDSFRQMRTKSSTKFTIKSKFDRSRFSTVLRSFSERRSSPRIARSNLRKSPVEEKNLPDIIEPLSSQQRAHSDTSVRRHGGKEIRAGRTTMILFIVSLIFVLSFVPYLAIVTMRYHNKDMVAYMSPAQLTIYNLTLRSYLLNSAVNPIVYCFLNRQFRMKVSLFCRTLFCKCRNQKQSDQGHSRQALQVH